MSYFIWKVTVIVKKKKKHWLHLNTTHFPWFPVLFSWDWKCLSVKLNVWVDLCVHSDPWLHSLWQTRTRVKSRLSLQKASGETWVQAKEDFNAFTKETHTHTQLHSQKYSYKHIHPCSWGIAGFFNPFSFLVFLRPLHVMLNRKELPFIPFLFRIPLRSSSIPTQTSLYWGISVGRLHRSSCCPW